MPEQNAPSPPPRCATRRHAGSPRRARARRRDCARCATSCRACAGVGYASRLWNTPVAGAGARDARLAPPAADAGATQLIDMSAVLSGRAGARRAPPSAPAAAGPLPSIIPGLRTPAPAGARKRLSTRVLTGVSIGAGCAAWIFSGATAHMATFVMMLAIAQLEYFRTVMLTGVYPARRIALASMVAANACARWAPSLHELVLPLSGVWVMLWFLLMRPKPGTIAEISTSYMGMFYLGHLPSYWVRVRALARTAGGHYAPVAAAAGRPARRPARPPARRGAAAGGGRRPPPHSRRVRASSS